MTKEDKLIKINNEIKSIINESTFISIKCRNKFIKTLGRIYEVDLPTENYQNVDITILDNGSIVMRDETYKREDSLELEEVLNRFESFKEEANNIINNNDKSNSNKKEVNQILNILFIIFIILLDLFFLKLFINAFISGNYFNCIWFVLVVSQWILPGQRNSLKERFTRAKRYIKEKFKK